MFNISTTLARSFDGADNYADAQITVTPIMVKMREMTGDVTLTEAYFTNKLSGGQSRTLQKQMEKTADDIVDMYIELDQALEAVQAAKTMHGKTIFLW